MEKQKAIEIPASERYDSPYSGEQETAILQHAEKLKDQTAASDGDTVQVYDVDGNPHKVAKSELLKKSTLALPDLSDISKFVAVNAKGDAIGLMTKEQVAQVLGELIGIDKTLKATGVFLSSNNDMNEIRQGIYTFAPETGYPANFPSTGGRGVVISYEAPPHVCQTVFSLSQDWAQLHVRLSYDYGVHWYPWREF